MSEIKKIKTSIISLNTKKCSHFPPVMFMAIGVMPLAAVLTFLFLGDKSFWLDEAFSITIAQMPWPDFWQTLFQYEANQGLYYFLLHIWGNIGQSEFVLRSLSAVFALCAVVMIYIFGTRLFGSRVGIIAALLITVNAFFIAYTQEARGYMLALFLATLSSYLFVKSIEKPGWKWWSAYVLLSALGVYAHLFVILVLVSQYASLIFLPRRDIPWRGLLISTVVMVLLLAPMAFFVLTRDIGQIGWISKPRLEEIFWFFNELSGRGGVLLTTVYLILGTISLFLMIKMYLKQKLSLNFWRQAFLLCWLFGPIVFSFEFSYIKPMFVPRYLLICLPPLVFLVANGISHIKHRWLMLTALGVLVLLSSFSLRDWYTSSQSKGYTQKDDWRGATGYLVSSARPGDVLIFFHPIIRVAFDYYYNRLEALDGVPTVIYYLPPAEGNLNLYYLPDGLAYGKDIPDPDRSIYDRLGGHERVWLVLESAFSSQTQMLKNLIQEKHSFVEELNYKRDIRIILYTLR